MKRLLSHDPITGKTEWWIWDSATRTASIRTEWDVTAILDSNKAAQNQDDQGWFSNKREMRRAASIPNAIIYKWLIEEGINIWDNNHLPAVRRKLNDPEWRWLRTAPGRL